MVENINNVAPPLRNMNLNECNLWNAAKSNGGTLPSKVPLQAVPIPA